MMPARVPERLVLATANAGKLRELSAMVRAWGVARVEPLADHPGLRLPEETGATYAANATLKAVAVATATGAPALADDSGLEVDALGGAPGVRSARYAPSDGERIAKLLAALAGVAPAARTARFRCVVALAWPDGRVDTGEGVCEGRILDAPVGTSGFGYDPVFWSADLGAAFAVVGVEAKESVSHRARAVRALTEVIGAS